MGFSFFFFFVIKHFNTFQQPGGVGAFNTHTDLEEQESLTK